MEIKKRVYVQYITWFVLHLFWQKPLEGVEDAGIGNDNRGMNLDLLLSFAHRHT